MKRNSLGAAAILGVTIGLGIAIAGIAVSSALAKSRASQRFVSVRGLAEREVDADLAIWPLTFKEAANDLADLQRRVDERRTVVASFLEGAGFQRSAISFAAPRITDLQAEGATAKGQTAPFRYVAQAVVTVRSKDVPAVKKAMEQAGTLVRQGVMLAQDWENRAQFLFEGLNSIKPEMIAEATVAAREAAVKFAKDSGSRIGRIRNASQGLFAITDRDPNSPERKVVRVVTTVEYFLDD